MRVIEVIPISRGITKETLSYFTAEAIEPGALVEVPLRSKTIPAIVIKTQDAAEAKANLKSASFAIRKVEKLNAKQFLAPEFMDSVYQIARMSAASTGSTLTALVPKEIFEESKVYEVPLETPASPAAETKLISHTSPSVHEASVLQAGFDDRISQYKSLIREYFAKKQSVFVCVPSIQDGRALAANLSKGIEAYTIVIHGQKKEKLADTWKKIAASTRPLLIIGTTKFLALPNRKISLIIIEKENAKGYKTIGRPNIDLRTFAEVFAKRRKIRLVYGDTLLRIETLWKHAQGECQEILSPSYRLRTQSTTETIVDMREYSQAKGRSFEILSDELVRLIEHNRAAKERMIIFTVRRGLAPITVCGDCGTIVKCHTCDAPINLHSSGSGDDKQFFFLCHRCGERRSAEERCAHCNSWKLVMLGIGIAGVEKALIEKFPDLPVFRIDTDTTTTDKKIQTTLTKFKETPGAVLLGTEMMVPYLEATDNVAVVSVDALFSLPDFRIHERLMYTLLSLRQISQKKFLLQTRAPQERVFEFALKSNIIEFYRQEIKDRQTYNYPPFSVLIKVTVKGQRATVQDEMDKIKKFLDPYDLSLFPAFVKSADGQFSMHGLIKVPRKEWVDETLLEKLRSLPPQCTVVVDPESLL